MRNALLLGVSLAALAACDLSPDYTLPDFSNIPGFTEQAADSTATPVAPATDGKWQRADEKAAIEEFAWWHMFNDPVLDALEEQAMAANPSLEVARQRLLSARAVAEGAAASLFPSIEAGFGPMRQRPSPAGINANSPAAFQVTSTKPSTLYTAQGTITYELDLFGGNRNSTRAAEFGADSEEAMYRAARLSLQAELAQAYFAFATLKKEADLLARTVESQKKSVALIREKRTVGAVDDLAVSAAETNLATTEADAASVAQQLAAQEHALAALVGVAPSQLTAPKAAALDMAPPTVPAGLPSALIERRPDIKAAQQRIAAANARIGSARAAYFPNISLSAMGGFTSSELSNLFDWSNRTWTIGPLAGTVLTQPLFEGGKLSAAIAERDANFQGAVAEYRSAVLQAFREVEDQLSGLHHLSQQASATDTAHKAATRSQNIVSTRYQVGAASYLDYLEAERSLLAAERRDIQVMANRYIATVQLVKALGGSWQSSPRPTVSAAPVAVETSTSVPAPAPAEPAATSTTEPLPPQDLPEGVDSDAPAGDAGNAPEWWEIWK